MTRTVLERMSDVGVAIGVVKPPPVKRVVRSAAEKAARVGKKAAVKAATATATTVSPFSIRTTAGKVFAGYALVNQAGNVAAAGKSVVEGFGEAREAGYSRARAISHAISASSVPLAFAASPLVTTATRVGAERALEVAKARGIRNDALKVRALRGVGTGLKVIGAVSAANNLIQAGLGSIQGASEDANAFRGAVRGALRTLDPSSIFYQRGYVERGFDRTFGMASAPSAPLPVRINNAMHHLAERAPVIGSHIKARQAAQPANGSQSVSGYTRPDGTYVRGYLRRKPQPAQN